MTRGSNGQASVEYLVLAFAIAIALGVGMSGEDSAMKQLMDALGTAYQRLSYSLSLPL